MKGHYRIVAKMPRARIHLSWNSISQLVRTLSEEREFARDVDLFTDKRTKRLIRNLAIKAFEKKGAAKIRFVKSEKAASRALFDYDSYTIETLPNETLQLHVLTDPWFDTYRRARLRRGWRNPMALAIDCRDMAVDFPSRHRLITFV